MKKRRYNITFPVADSHHLGQNEVYFTLQESGQNLNLRFHDYSELYRRPGLYEQLFYDRLKCSSPQKVCAVLDKVMQQSRSEMSELRVLDVGAGNGMVGECLFNAGVSRLIGVDISPEAQSACERDRPGVYDAYYVADLCQMNGELDAEIRAWQTDCMTCVAALGFDDIPTRAFINAFNFVRPGGWIVFNIKETFLQESDDSGLSRLIKQLLLKDNLEVHHLERYRHRLSIDGSPLYYYVLAGKKESDIPAVYAATLA
ncbi:MAG: class I SAM-dependent methyltransferase [Methylococcaceae bacterium]|nr:class I SAM-dependent methyltransferase [Methylococcaceae bacterium]